jgi:hypothetical protein
MGLLACPNRLALLRERRGAFARVGRPEHRANEGTL